MVVVGVASSCVLKIWPFTRNNAIISNQLLAAHSFVDFLCMCRWSTKAKKLVQNPFFVALCNSSGRKVLIAKTPMSGQAWRVADC